METSDLARRVGESVEDLDWRTEILWSHVGAVRFAPGTEPADVMELAVPPHVLIWLADDFPSWGLWGYATPADGPELARIQLSERDNCGGDPTWSASPSDLVPIIGVRYSVDGVEREAISWPGFGE